MSITNATGIQMARSSVLGVRVFSTRLIVEKTTTIQINQREARDQLGSAIPARASTTSANKARITAYTTAATRNSGGNCPGNAPPIA